MKLKIPVSIYLEGTGALIPVSATDRLFAQVGDKKSRIMVEDFRIRTLEGLKRLAKYDKGKGVYFGKVFCENALATIYVGPFWGIKITLVELSKSITPDHTLYLGTNFVKDPTGTYWANKKSWAKSHKITIDGQEAIAFCCLRKLHIK